MRLPRFARMWGIPNNHKNTDCEIEEDGDTDTDVDAYTQPFEGTEEIEIEEGEGEFCEEQSGGYESIAEEGDGLVWVVRKLEKGGEKEGRGTIIKSLLVTSPMVTSHWCLPTGPRVTPDFRIGLRNAPIIEAI
ncbi:hypothetical protein BOTCAL_0363g00010 [Botryotinia calthae]|uniref:Uncharacterized protein n=1 Tax=Botryotinia calthae TaxID=38488 RepID=A0A4Y8CUG9_9HELO|nr:hypothetical protein BOTCAL_0363g00010 [Botryotinia calthae]